jgi:hypothetical protein
MSENLMMLTSMTVLMTGRFGRVSWPRCVGATVGLLAAVGVASAAGPATYRGFAHPRPVTIRGYRGDAMEPFITLDGRYLLFNNLNQPSVHTTLRYAKRLGADTFVYGGEIAGANDATALNGVPSVTARGELYFISPRSYGRTLSTIYRARLVAGRASGVALAPGLATRAPGTVDFDADVNAQGTGLYVAQGRFTAGGEIETAKLVHYTRRGAGFVADPRGERLLRAVNRAGALVYAAGLSADGLELFFTREDPGAVPAIYRAVRADLSRPFGEVERVAGATGFVEAPSLSADGTVLYYHRMVGSRFVIYALTRSRAAVIRPRGPRALR